MTPDECTTLDEVRAEIDRLDRALMPLLAERQAFADRAGALKAGTGISAAAPSRAAAVIEKVRELAGTHGFDPDTAAQMWRVMIDAFVAREETTLGPGGRDE